MMNRGRMGPSLRRSYRQWFTRFPWWLALLLGVVAIAIGAAITLKPFASLGVLVVLVAVAFVVTGMSEIVSARSTPARWIGAAWIAIGITIVVWPGLSIRAIAVIVGFSLLAGGLHRMLSALRGDADDRLISGISGLVRAIFGGLALGWPDVTILVVSLLVGPAMIVFGLGQVASALELRASRDGGARPVRKPRPAWLRLTGVLASLVPALGLLALSMQIHRASSGRDPFYATPEQVPSEPGVLLRSEPFSRGIPDSARAWRILYTSTRDDNTPVLASGIVLVSKEAPEGPRPVIAWAHGTTGFAQHCAPSLLRDPLASGAMPALDQVIANGWVLVATDYVGLGTAGPHPYLIGEPVARSVLDAVRAARQLDGVELEPRTVVWGHSQGGDAALWTGMIAPRYAPDVNVIGVAALAPAADVLALVEDIQDSAIGKILGSYVLAAYSAIYPDVRFDDYVRPGARVHARETARRCLSGPEVLVSAVTAAVLAAGDGPYFSRSPSTGPLGERLQQNIPLESIPAPLLIGQGLGDELILPAGQDDYVARLCAAGQSLQYRRYAGLGHVDLVLGPASLLVPDLLAWTQDRLEGRPQRPGCETVER